MSTKNILLLVVLGAFISVLLFLNYGRSFWYPYYSQLKGKRTTAEIIASITPGVMNKLRPRFEYVGSTFPPDEITLLAFKDRRVLEVWVRESGKNKKVLSYPIKAASGQLGPKLREGDRQVPEGIYEISGFNPNSAYHLSMKLNYPNQFDLRHANAEGRNEPGSNIFIHGKAASIGCLAMGDEAIEELFALVHVVGRQNVEVIISPRDPALEALTPPAGSAQWVTQLYQEITRKIGSLRAINHS